jgi:hypothetical protein
MDRGVPALVSRAVDGQANRPAARSTNGVLERLQPREAECVLRTLVRAHPEMAPVAEEIAISLLKDVSCDHVAKDVEEAIGHLGMEDMDSGPSPLGYSELVDEAWDVLDKTLEPFLEDLKRHIALDLEIEALELCKGILLGLYRLREDQRHEVLAQAPDFLMEAAGETAAAWRHTQRLEGRKRRRRRRPEFPTGFLRKQVPEWRALIERAARGRAKRDRRG